MKTLQAIAFELSETHGKLINMVKDLEHLGEQPPIAVNQVMEEMAEAVTNLYFYDETERARQAQAIDTVLLNDALQVMTMLYQAVYDGKVLFQHDVRRIKDTIELVDQKIKDTPKVIDLPY